VPGIVVGAIMASLAHSVVTAGFWGYDAWQARKRSSVAQTIPDSYTLGSSIASTNGSWTYMIIPSPQSTTTLGQSFGSDDAGEYCRETTPGHYECPKARGICDDPLAGGKVL
jgi:hypothetical protein